MEDVKLLDEETGCSAETPLTPKAAPFLQGALLQGYALAVLDMLLDVYGAVVTKLHGAAFTSMDINAVRFGSAAVVLALMVPCAALGALLLRRIRPRDQAPDGTCPDDATVGATSYLCMVRTAE